MKFKEKINVLKPYNKLLCNLESQGFDEILLDRTLGSLGKPILQAMIAAGKKEAIRLILGEPIAKFTIEIPEPSSRLVASFINYTGNGSTKIDFSKEFQIVKPGEHYEVQILKPIAKFTPVEVFDEISSRGAALIGMEGAMVVYKYYIHELGIDFSKELAHFHSFGKEVIGDSGGLNCITNFSMKNEGPVEINPKHGVNLYRGIPEDYGQSFYGNGECLICVFFKK